MIHVYRPLYIKLKHIYNVYIVCDYCDPTIKFLYHFSLKNNESLVELIDSLVSWRS